MDGHFLEAILHNYSYIISKNGIKLLHHLSTILLFQVEHSLLRLIADCVGQVLAILLVAPALLHRVLGGVEEPVFLAHDLIRVDRIVHLRCLLTENDLARVEGHHQAIVETGGDERLELWNHRILHGALQSLLSNALLELLLELELGLRNLVGDEVVCTGLVFGDHFETKLFTLLHFLHRFFVFRLVQLELLLQLFLLLPLLLHTCL